MFSLKPYLPYLFLLVLVASCKPSDDEIPSYVHVPAMDVYVTDPLQGTASQNITDVWMYADDELIGVYPLPVTIPILKTGSTKLTFSPGILANGISNTRVQYPFYTDTAMVRNLVAGQVDTITPFVRYRSATTYLLNENFENGNDFTNMERTVNQADAFEGASSGHFLIDTTRNVRAVTSTKFQVLQESGVIVFVELNYKSSHVMQAGIIARSSTQGDFVLSKVFISPQDDWNKIYINFTPEINTYLVDEFQFFLEVLETNSTDDIEIYVDNVKILLDQ